MINTRVVLESKSVNSDDAIREGRVAAATIHGTLVGVCIASLPWKDGRISGYLLISQSSKEAAV
ncbi:MAG: hypothetical protein WCS71_07855 [Sphaerochaetaceae bacterium]|jgi:hypothetical protein